jgi:protein-tyrosine phosphatase
VALVVKWLGERGRDGGIDTVPLPTHSGGMSLCGKHAIAPDVEAAMSKCGATTVVCLVEEREVAGHWPHYVDWLHEHRGTTAVWFPIHDLNAPPLEQAEILLGDLLARLERDEHLLMHCAAGIGRTGTMAACILVRLGMDIDEALALVRNSRPMAGPEVGAQLDLVKEIAARRAG